MALGDTNSNQFTQSFERILAKFLYKEEIRNLLFFTRHCDIDRYLQKIKNKIGNLQIPKEDHVNILRNSLHDDVFMEIQSVSDWENEIKEFDSFCAFLCKIFRQKKSAVTNLINLLDIKQSPAQSTRDFLSVIRVEGHKVLANENAEDREKLLVKAFINGLSNRKVSEVLNHLSPKNLDEAFKLVKYEKTEDSSASINAIHNSNEFGHLMTMFKKMQAEISQLKQQISSLLGKSSNVNTASPRNSSFNRPTQQNVSQHILCYRCNKNGHFANRCSNKPFCPKCRVEGHSLRDCSKNQKFRQFNLTPSVENSPPNTIDLNDIEDDQEDIPIGQIACLSANKKTKTYSECVKHWADYIEGNATKPSSPLSNFGENEDRINYHKRNNNYQISSISGKTLISENNPELACNKPVVHCRIYGKKQAVLFDSGAEVNVIDLNYLNSLKQVNPKIKFIPRQGSLRCANGSKLNILGYTGLTLTIGVQSVLIKFIVVDNMFPKVVIGLPSMKKHNISIIPSSDSIEICGILIPFISRSVVSGN